MTTTLNATFDGEAFRTDTPVDLPVNTRVRVTIEIEEPARSHKSFFETARSLNFEGPADWSERFHEYASDNK